ncbi:MAG: helix-turn-helix transcriptional regulator [Candidatus Hodarchaeota archaeon]
MDEIFNYEPIIKIKREEFNLSQEQLAMLIGISTEDLKKLENEEYDQPPEFITKIATQLNCEVEDLVE